MTPPRASTRHWSDTLRQRAATVLGFGLAVLALFTAGFGSISEFLLRGIVLGTAGIAMLLLQPSAARGRPARVFALGFDVVLGIALITSIGWFLWLSDRLWSGLYILTTTDLTMAGAGLLALMELTRRAIGAPLAILAGLALVYALLGDNLPWIFRHAGYSPAAVAQTVWYGLDGVYGIAAAVMVSVVFIYIIFGAILEATGAGDIMLRVATRSTDGLKGGAAHSAVAASGLFGMISGSVTANVVGTGVFTMSLMKRRGFQPAFAGGVEASASAAGQFLPPVMGAAAFLMSELVGISFLTICVAAALPALFFFASLFVGVWLEASRQGMAPTPATERETLTWHDFVQSLLFVVPIGVILTTLISGRSPAMAGFYAIASAIICALLINPDLRRNPVRLLRGLAKGGLSAARIMVAVGSIGILIGVLNLTGLGTRIADTILSFGGDTLFISLLLTMAASIVLGMGLPTLPAYLLIVILVGPVLERLGVPLLAAHLFVMYFAVFSALTPPVALAAFAAAPIVDAPPVKIGLSALRLSAVGFMIPFVFAFQPELLIIFAETPLEIIWVGFRLLAAIWLIATGVNRFERCGLTTMEALARIAAGVLTITTLPYLQLAGLAGGLILVLYHRLWTTGSQVRE